MQSRETFGRGVALRRKTLGMTQAELAEAVEISTQFLAAIEQGNKAPSFDTIDKLVDALGASPEAIFAAGGPDRPTRTSSTELVRAVQALAPEHEAAVLEVVRAISKLVSTTHRRPGATGTAPQKASKSRATNRRKRS